MGETADTDWERWVPPVPQPDTGVKKFKTGQVWAGKTPGWEDSPSVVLFLDDFGACVPLAGAGAASCPRQVPIDSPWARHAVLVQDAGQPYPARPEVLYGSPPAPAVPVDRRPPVLPAPRKRRVSTNGRDWVDYDAMADGDPFESYAWRDVVDADGNVTHWYPAADAVMREQALSLHLHLEQEVGFKMACREHDDYRAAAASARLAAMIASDHEPEERPVRECVPTLYGGVFSLR